MPESCYPTTTNWSCMPAAELAEADEDLKAYAEAMAWNTLAALTGYAVAICPSVVRPISRGCISRGSYMAAPVTGPGQIPWLSSAWGSLGLWAIPCRCSATGSEVTVDPTDPDVLIISDAANDSVVDYGGCDCVTTTEVVLPGPIGGIDSIVINGEVIPTTAYRVYDGNRLVRIDGQSWPVGRDIDVAGDTFVVRYFQGVAPDAMLNMAAGILAKEFLAACGGGDCRLPAGVTSISRQGIEIEVNQGMFTNNLTGIPEVDAIIRIYNPYSRKSQPSVHSFDQRRPRVKTGSY